MPNTHKRTLPICSSAVSSPQATTQVSTTDPVPTTDPVSSVAEDSKNSKNAAAVLGVTDLAGVVYSSGKVFDGLTASRHATVNFLRSGSLDGITSRSDLALLQDLRDVSQYIIDNRQAPIDSTYVREVNARITRSGPLHPGYFRTDRQQIGVGTSHGRHAPKPIDNAGLQRIVDEALAQPNPREQALELFVLIAKAQPFEDGNKRTALFVANSVLIRGPEPEMLVVPTDENSTDENSTDKAARFNDLLARAYVLSEHDGIKDLLRAEGAELSQPALDRLPRRDHLHTCRQHEG